MVGVSASVNLPMHHKVQKFSSGTGSPSGSRKSARKWLLWYIAYHIFWKLSFQHVCTADFSCQTLFMLRQFWKYSWHQDIAKARITVCKWLWATFMSQSLNRTWTSSSSNLSYEQKTGRVDSAKSPRHSECLMSWLSRYQFGSGIFISQWFLILYKRAVVYGHHGPIVKF